jgi:integrase
VAVRKSGDRWIIEFMFRGERIFRRLPKGQGKQQAQALESKLRSQIFDAVDLGKLPDPLLSKVIQEWAKGKDDKAQSHINAVLQSIPATARLSEVGSVRDSLISRWPDLAPGTINRRLSVLKASAKFAFRRKWTKTNLSAEVALLPEPKYIRREVTPEMAQELIRNASTPRAKALIAGSAYTGMRLSEVLRFDPKRDIQEGAIRVRDNAAGYEDRLIPILPELVPHLKQFPMDKTGWRNVYRGFERAREKAGLEIRYHDLRHMAASAMINAGFPDRVVADILGHKTTQTTRKYTHPSLETKRKALGSITAGLHQAGRKSKKKARK